MVKDCPFATEAELVACWLDELRQNKRQSEHWTVYPETAGWDLLLVHRDGYQLGVEAKLSLNAKVLAQALDGSDSYWRDDGPDYRAVLVPDGRLQHFLAPVARALGLGIFKAHPRNLVAGWHDLRLPDQSSLSSRDLPNWLPETRCPVPDYVPDVTAGVASPVQLTHWKVKAIKLMILLERRGYVTRGDMKALQISPTRFTDPWNGLLDRDPGRGGFVSGARTPDLRKQHPVNYVEIEADYAKWCPPGYRFETDACATPRNE